MQAHGSNPILSRQITSEEWEAASVSDTPKLPWTIAGTRVAGFVLMPIPECPMGNTVVFIDADGEPLCIGNEGPMAEMVRRLQPRLSEVTLLPK
jgi:hypothetical protein